MSSYAQEKYPRDIKAACNLYHTQYLKTTKSNDKNEGSTNTKQDKDEDDDNKDGFVTAHISMDSAANILAVHALNECMWETTDDDDIGSLVGKEDLACCHFLVPPLEESEE